ncbi:MAG: hypothetical protein JWN95_172 [Frankiales bacterium]|nr:hypothetical protein [Frankiales bacterium]
MTAPTSLTGRVSVRTVAAGSKSARPAVVLQASDRDWVLRRRGAGAFDIDQELSGYANELITVSGEAGSGVFLVDSVDSVGSIDSADSAGSVDSLDSTAELPPDQSREES